jgi:hypothetical protein
MGTAPTTTRPQVSGLARTAAALADRDVAAFSDRELTTRYADINSLADSISRMNVPPPAQVDEDLATALGNVLHEMIVRRLTLDYPAATYIALTGYDVTYCSDDDGGPATWCAGHSETLRAEEIYDEDGNLLGLVDSDSPVQFWLERKATISHTAPHYLINLKQRLWSIAQ